MVLDPNFKLCIVKEWVPNNLEESKVNTDSNMFYIGFLSRTFSGQQGES